MRIFQIVFGDIDETIQRCMGTVKSIYPEVEVLQFPKSSTPVIDSDKLRVEVLSGEDDILYIDWDIILSKELQIDKTSPYLSCNFFKGKADYSLIYSPNKKIWEKIEKERIRRKISTTTYAWLRKIFRNMTINELTGFDHMRYTSRDKE